MITKRDLNAIARAILNADADYEAKEAVVKEMCIELKRNNPRFKEGLFRRLSLDEE